MAKKKYHYYVLVITNEGPVFVTKVNNSNHSAYWNASEKPLDMSADMADTLAFGLNCNMTVAYAVKSRVELTTQPYRYDDFDFTFVEKNKEE